MPRPFRRAFTMIELLVVIGILVLLISILLPAISKAYNEARRNSDAADLAAISQALDAYRNDFGDYPRLDILMAGTGNPYRGSSILCWALVAPGPSIAANPQFGAADGADGPGFRVRGTQGTVHQSYLNLDRFKLAMVGGGAIISVPANGMFDDAHAVILDRFGQPILYFPANTAAVVTANQISSYVGQGTYAGSTTPVNPATNPRYNTNDAPITQLFSYNIGAPFTPLQAMLRLMPGITTQTPTGSVMQTLDPSAATNANFLLWSAGPDGKFGGDDDVTNFR